MTIEVYNYQLVKELFKGRKC